MSSPRSRRELGGCREPPGAAGSCREPPGASQEGGQELSGAARSRQGAARSCPELTQKPPGAVGRRRELSGAARSLGSMENRATRAGLMIPPPTVGPLWGLEIQPELRSWRETSGEH